MYVPDGNELVVTTRDDRGAHKLTVDHEDYARLLNQGVSILNETAITRPEEDSVAHG
jgi:hypothetical protein